MNNVLIGIGSNAQARAYLYQSLQWLSKSCCIRQLSGCYLNNAVYLPSQALVKTPNYVNSAVLVTTALNFVEFSALLKEVELSIGGIRAGGLCALDLDIIAFEGAHRDGLGTVRTAQQAEHAYVWCCVAELCPQLNFSLVYPRLWQRQHWPEFMHWQEHQISVAQEITNLLVLPDASR